MKCDQFLRGYSDFRDGWLDAAQRRKFEDHLQQCDGCRRYDRVVRRGVQVLRSLPAPSPSPDSLPRLKHRIFHEEDGLPLSASAGGSAALVAVATVGILALAWLPFALRTPVELELPTVSVDAPAVEGAPASSSASSSLFSDGPFVTPVLNERRRDVSPAAHWEALRTGGWTAGTDAWAWSDPPPESRAARRGDSSGRSATSAFR